MALTLPRLGVDVSLVEPGAVATRLTKSMSLSVQELVSSRSAEIARRHSCQCKHPKHQDALCSFCCTGGSGLLAQEQQTSALPFWSQLEDYKDEQYTQMLETFWPHFAESLKPEHGAQAPDEVGADFDAKGNRNCIAMRSTQTQRPPAGPR